MKKFIFLLLMIIIPINLYAVSSYDVDYEIEDYIVDASIDISGNLLIKEVIRIDGTYNGYIRDLVYKNNNLSEFTGSVDDFKGSSIYNGSGIEIIKVGTVNYDKELGFDVFDEDVKESSECSNRFNCYTKSSLSNGVSLKMYNETEDGSTYFYIEYLIGNVAVIHEDVAEVYFNFIGDMFDDDINSYKLRLSLPLPTKEQVRVWAHGPLTGEVNLMKKDDDYYGGYLTIDNLSANTPVDMRLVFPKELIAVDHPYLKKSGVVALDNILEVEEERANEANEIREKARIKVYGTYGVSIFYILCTVALIIYIYIKYDKELKSEFDLEYNREFIDDYDVTVIEYLFDKRITEKGFSTSILNMIFKKNISFTELDKNDYMLTKVSEDNLNDAEKIVMDIIFNEAGDGKTTTLKKINKYASTIKGTKSPFLTLFESWKRKVTRDSEKENFYESQVKVKTFAGLYSIFGFLVLFLHMSVGLFTVLTFIVLIFTIVFIIYISTFTKRTKKGALHYAKWSAFKRFLEDFGRFDEKELPEIVLWERYLVYASIFGIAEKLGKTMKIKFNELNYNTNKDILFDYMMWTNINNSINRAVHSSITTAQSKVAEATARELSSSSNSSGGGFGGGFSSGGGFGGGGGGGRGF